MTEKFSLWDPIDYLKTDDDLVLYLNACIDKDTGDGSVVRAALNDLARARSLPPDGDQMRS